MHKGCTRCSDTRDRLLSYTYQFDDLYPITCTARLRGACRALLALAWSFFSSGEMHVQSIGACHV